MKKSPIRIIAKDLNGSGLAVIIQKSRSPFSKKLLFTQ